MRRWMVTIGVVLALVLVPGSAAQASGGWEPAPTEPFDRAAGEICDVPIHAEPTVDEVVMKTLADGSVIYTGKLVVRVTNRDSGAYTDVDASGSALVTHAADGSMTWYVAGPVLIPFREGAGNRPRGLYRLDGVYRIAYNATLTYKKLTMVHGTTEDVCALID